MLNEIMTITPIKPLKYPETKFRTCKCGCVCNLGFEDCECILEDCNCPKKTMSEWMEIISGVNKELLGKDT